MSKSLCSYPFKHILADTNGHQKICCMPMEYIEKSGGYRHYTMKDGLTAGWNSDYMKDIRLKMSRGEKVSTCAKCYHLESLGLQSLRTMAGIQDANDYLSKMNNDGSLNIMPSKIELHFGNICNLRCRMCSHYYSHAWGKELLQIQEKDPDFFKWIQQQGGNVNGWTTGNLSEVYDWFKDKELLLKVFKEISDYIEDIQIIGGEPTVIPEFWQLFEFLKEQNTISQKKIQINTNGTNINLKIIKYFKDLKQSSIWVSVDALDRRNRYIRFPCDWSTILKNLKIYQDLNKETPSIQYCVSPTPQILNVDQLVDFVLFFEGIGHPVSIIPKVTSPKILDYHFFPYEYKLLLKEKLFKNIHKITDQRSKSIVQGIINSLDLEAEKDEIKNNIKNFVIYMDYLDKHRKEESWRVLLPDLEKIILNF